MEVSFTNQFGKAATDIMCGHCLPPVHLGITPPNNHRQEEHTKELIDYCFINRGFQPVSYHRITDKVWGLYPSDHYGIQAIIKAE